VKIGRSSNKARNGVFRTPYTSREVDRIVHDAAQREGKRFKLTDGQRKTLRGTA
jgi:hypothetical protein